MAEFVPSQDVFCSTKPSWQGDRCAPPLHPPARGSYRASSPLRSQQTVSPVNHSARRLRSPCTHRSRGLSRPPEPHSQDLETCLSTCTEPCTTGCPLDRQSWARSCSPDTPMTISWRRLHRDQGKGAFALPFPGPTPSTWGPSAPRPPTNPARIGCRHLVEDGPRSGLTPP